MVHGEWVRCRDSDLLVKVKEKVGDYSRLAETAALNQSYELS